MAGSQVDDFRAGMPGSIITGFYMTASQVNHVNEIPHTGAVRRGIIIAEYGKLFQFAHCYLGNIRHKIVWNPGGVFADQTGRMSADRIEVAKQDNAPFGISCSLAFQNLFNHIFGPAVGVGTACGNHILPIRNNRLIAVYSRGRGKNNLFDIVRLHCFTKGQSCIQIVAVITERLGDAFADSFQAGEMDHAVKLVLAEDPIHCGFIRNIRFIMRNRMADDLLDTADGFRRTVDIIIHDHRIVAGVTKLHTGMGSDKTGAAGQ